MQIMSMCTITNLINLHVALPPDTERVTTVSAVRRAVEGLVLVIITGTTISTPGAASLPSVTCSKLNWNAAEKREKWKRNFIAKVRQRNLTIEIFRRLSTIVYHAKIKLGHLTCGEFSREHKFSWITNTSGKKFFCDKVWPHLLQNFPHAKGSTVAVRTGKLIAGSRKIFAVCSMVLRQIFCRYTGFAAQLSFFSSSAKKKNKKIKNK